MGLEIRNVARSFGDRVALDGVSFDVAPGVLTGLLGPNGAGKTTLLRIMLGVFNPDRGEVRYDGRPVGEETRGPHPLSQLFLAAAGRTSTRQGCAPVRLRLGPPRCYSP